MAGRRPESFVLGEKRLLFNARAAIARYQQRAMKSE